VSKTHAEELESYRAHIRQLNLFYQAFHRIVKFTGSLDEYNTKTGVEHQFFIEHNKTGNRLRRFFGISERPIGEIFIRIVNDQDYHIFSELIAKGVVALVKYEQRPFSYGPGRRARFIPYSTNSPAISGLNVWGTPIVRKS
jgi:hypothetical protein